MAQQRVWRILGLAVVIALFVYVAVTAAGGFQRALDALEAADPWWLVPAGAAVVLRFGLITTMLRRLQPANDRPPLRLTVEIALITFGFGAMLPAAPAEGITMSVLALRRLGRGEGKWAMRLFATQAAQWVALVVVFALARLAVLIRQPAERGGWSAIAMALALLVAAWLVVGLARHPSAAIAIGRLTHRLPIRTEGDRDRTVAAMVDRQRTFQEAFGPPARQVVTIGLGAIAWLLDGSVMWMMIRSTGHHVGFEVAIFAHALGVLITLIPLSPSGLGLVELAVPRALAQFGVPAATGLAAVLMWRAVAMLTTTCIGGLTYLAVRVRPAHPLVSDPA